MAYVFFASYARADRSRVLDRFLTFLRDDVGSKTGIASENVCFYDMSAIRAGSEWKDRLFDGLRSSQVLVLFYSPRYVRSKYCGKEVRAFLHRIDVWQQGKPGQEIRAVFPVIWETHAPMPEVISRFQYADGAFPEKYTRLGLRELGVLKRHRESFREVSIELAKRIQESTRSAALPHAGDLPPLDSLESVWEWQPEWQPFNVSAVFWLAKGGEWTPFSGDHAIAEIVEEVASDACLASREITTNGNFVARLCESEASRDAIIVLTTLAELASPANAARLKQFDESAPPNCGLLIIWEDAAPDQEAAAIELRRLLPNRHSAYDELTSVTSPTLLRAKLETMIARLLALIGSASAPGARVESLALMDAAASVGLVAPGAVPNLTGPAKE